MFYLCVGGGEPARPRALSRNRRVRRRCFWMRAAKCSDVSLDRYGRIDPCEAEEFSAHVRLWCKQSGFPISSGEGAGRRRGLVAGGGGKWIPFEVKGVQGRLLCVAHTSPRSRKPPPCFANPFALGGLGGATPARYHPLRSEVRQHHGGSDPQALA